jgi:ATP-dependent exoDNAse (exonuclease V) beta subunit
MNSASPFPKPQDQTERDRALDPTRSVLVQAPAGSGKTTLLTERFLRLLAVVDDPSQIVAITFTNAAAAEMRNRVLTELAKDHPSPLAQSALNRSAARGWNLLDLPAQLRISTIDSFCRELALQQPLLSGFGGALNIAQPPDVLYRHAARRTLETMDNTDAPLREAISDLLSWRDNNWNDLEDQLVDMLSNRDRWMQDFLIESNPDWEILRARLEHPFAPNTYTDDEWRIVRASFLLLRYAAAQLKIVFAENASVDFTEVAQIAQSVLRVPDGSPSDAAIAVADGIHHLLVDEFQDTSRRQHQLLASLVAAWPDRVGRTCFVVGDPMQSIYFFRNADAELFFRVRTLGLEIPGNPPLPFDFVKLTSNFRTVAPLVEDLNKKFNRIFAADDASGIAFSPSVPALSNSCAVHEPLSLNFAFVPHTAPFKAVDPATRVRRQQAHELQIQQIVSVIQGHLPRINEAHAADEHDSKKYRIAVLARVKKSLIPIAQALRTANIPFRAVELEDLRDRPEILDALSLARALLNPQDRVAWLGVLRAPWSGLSLADLAILAEEPNRAGPTRSGSDRAARPIPDLLAERISLLSPEARPAAERVLHAIAAAPTLRAAQPSAALGTWLQQVWLMLGGDATVDRTARANVDLLFARLDKLPEADADLVGPALNAALKNLTALPNPEAHEHSGVQLMTIHKSKGLEFEVVIVPDLQLEDRKTQPAMLSWLERGIPPDSPSLSADEVTEFLIAPIQSKGAKKGSAKEFVDQARRVREQQESRRILYVAATRARDELHLFARPEYKIEKTASLSKEGLETKTGSPTQQASLTLVEPSNSLLATAWPALKDEVRKHFDKWKSEQAAAQPSLPLSFESFSSDPQPVELFALAAAAETNIVQMPSPSKPSRLRRLPPDFSSGNQSRLAVERLLTVDSAPAEAPLYARHEGGLASRALGTAVHALLQQLAHLRVDSDWPSASAALQKFAPRIQSAIRSTGVDPAQAESLTAEAMRLALNTSNDPTAAWILSPHPGAASEIRWTGVLDGTIHSVQIDRLFQAGSALHSEGESVWWIIDYKTAHAPAALPNASPNLTALRSLYARQLEIYSRVLRNLYGANAAVRAGLYYPRMAAFDSWEL